MTKKYDMVQLKKLVTEFEVATGEMRRFFNEQGAAALPETTILPEIMMAVSSGSQEKLQEALEQYRDAVERERSVEAQFTAARARHRAAKQAFLAAIGLV